MFKEAPDHGRWLVFPKGRRLGATHGAAFACIEWALAGHRVLWGDVIYGNIRKYVDRYFLPALRERGISHAWKSQDAVLEISPGYIDFRSADKPEKWEGFGYDRIFLNEAGIILDDPYLYYNSVLPMMIDSKHSVLIAAGTPKLSQNIGVLFKELWDKAEAGEPGYYGHRFSTYDNPYLDKDAIETLEAEILPGERPQEIHGEFITPAGLGAFFKRSWFTVVDEIPKVVRKARAWDFAATEPHEGNQNPDWTVGVLMGVTSTGQVIILDVVMARVGPTGVDALVERTAAADGAEVEQVIPIDPGAAGKTAAKHFENGPLKNSKVATYAQTRAQGSKATRATPFSIAAGKGDMLLAPGSWHSWFFGQLEPFPNERVHDDAVDAGAAAYNHLTGHKKKARW
jgi:predicted phage terminase large subunit-like protein